MNSYIGRYENIGEDVKQIMNKLLSKQSQHPDSFLFATNTLAVHGLKEIIKKNFIIPDEVGIISFDQSDAHDFFYSPITYIDQNITQIGKEAVKILMNLLDKTGDELYQPDISFQAIINSRLVVRESCGEKKKK